MEKYSQLLILSEDSMHRSFVLGFLSAAKVEKHKIRELNAPFYGGTAKGPQGNSWVQSRFEAEVCAVHKRINGKRASTLLVVVYDADDKLVQDVQHDFDNKVQLAQRDCYALLIPKRNIESWVYFDLNDTSCDESEDLGHCYGNKQARHAGVNVFKLIQSGLVNMQSLPPSLQLCWKEFLKIKKGL